MYLTYEEYTATGGQLPEVTFERCEASARYHLDTFTFGRLRRDTPQRPAVKSYMRDAIEVVAVQLPEKTGGVKGKVASIRNEGVSESYVTSATTTTAAVTSQELFGIAKMYLLTEFDAAGIPLLYRGVD